MKEAQKSVTAGPYSIGGTPYPGLSKLIEEAGEVIQVAGKLIATGGASEHWDGSDLRARLQEEIADVMAACRFVIDWNGLDHEAIEDRMDDKQRLFDKWHREQRARAKKP